MGDGGWGMGDGGKGDGEWGNGGMGGLEDGGNGGMGGSFHNTKDVLGAKTCFPCIF